MDSGAKQLVEFKARYEDHGKARALLATADHVGTVRQVDTYFSLGERRLKVRTFEGREDGQLVYYERPDAGGVKSSEVLLASLPRVRDVLEILRRVLPVQAEVRKVRDLFRFQGVQVHLDVVEGLGRFLEFERVLEPGVTEVEARAQLEGLRAYFQVPEEDVMASSYSDLVSPPGP